MLLAPTTSLADLVILNRHDIKRSLYHVIAALEGYQDTLTELLDELQTPENKGLKISGPKEEDKIKGLLLGLEKLKQTAEALSKRLHHRSQDKDRSIILNDLEAFSRRIDGFVTETLSMVHVHSGIYVVKKLNRFDEQTRNDMKDITEHAKELSNKINDLLKKLQQSILKTESTLRNLRTSKADLDINLLIEKCDKIISEALKLYSSLEYNRSLTLNIKLLGQIKAFTEEIKEFVEDIAACFIADSPESAKKIMQPVDEAIKTLEENIEELQKVLDATPVLAGAGAGVGVGAGAVAAQSAPAGAGTGAGAVAAQSAPAGGGTGAGAVAAQSAPAGAGTGAGAVAAQSAPAGAGTGAGAVAAQSAPAGAGTGAGAVAAQSGSAGAGMGAGAAQSAPKDDETITVTITKALTILNPGTTTQKQKDISLPDDLGRRIDWYKQIATEDDSTKRAAAPLLAQKYLELTAPSEPTEENLELKSLLPALIACINIIGKALRPLIEATPTVKKAGSCTLLKSDLEAIQNSLRSMKEKLQKHLESYKLPPIDPPRLPGGHGGGSALTFASTPSHKPGQKQKALSPS
jgi:hypothetical protein